jgi:glycosidase
MRKQHQRLFVDGTLTWLLTDDTNDLLAYERALGDRRAIVALNASDNAHEVAVAANGRYRLVYPAGDTVSASGGTLRAVLPPRTARVWIRE